MKFIRLPFAALVYFSVATMIAEATLLGVLWVKGRLTNDTIVQLLAISNDVDLQTMRRKLEDEAGSIKVEQISFEDVLRARKQISLDLDLQEIAADKGLIDIQRLDFELERERTQYDALKEDFDLRIEKVREGAVDESLTEVQRQLQSVDAKLAKDQLLRILDDPDFDPQKSMQFVVTMFKSMPLEHRKKILAQFKDAAELQRLHEILRQIRLGFPDVEVIRQTREQLERLESRSS